MNETMRLFVALTIPAEVKQALAELREELGTRLPSLRWVRQEGVHLTLAFLGEVPVDRVGPVRQLLAGCPGGLVPPELESAGLGVFPHQRAPRVLWAGFREAPEAVLELQRRVAQAMSAEGFPMERRPFRPHLTVGRFRRPLRRSERELLSGLLQRDAQRSFGRFTARRLSLYRSTLLPAGARYEELDGWPLDGTAGPSD